MLDIIFKKLVPRHQSETVPVSLYLGNGSGSTQMTTTFD